MRTAQKQDFRPTLNKNKLKSLLHIPVVGEGKKLGELGSLYRF